MLAHDLHRGLVGGHGMKDLAKLQGQHLVRRVAQHLGERTIGEQNGAVLGDGQHRHRKPLEHHQCRQLFEHVHRLLVGFVPWRAPPCRLCLRIKPALTIPAAPHPCRIPMSLTQARLCSDSSTDAGSGASRGSGSTPSNRLRQGDLNHMRDNAGPGLG